MHSLSGTSRRVEVTESTTAAESEILRVSGLTVEYPMGRKRPPMRAVDEVNISIGPAESVGLVGESGSGKSTVGRAILGVAPIKSGQVVFDGRDITSLSDRQRRPLSAELQVIFQDPYSSLNPTRTIGQTLSEPLRVHSASAREARVRAAQVLESVGLPVEAASRYPAQFSGGQRQRIAIARALVMRPRLIICDEPVSALDLSVQAQVLNLLRELQDSMALSLLFISHDLTVVRHVSHRIVVLYRGRVMEEGNAEVVYSTPRHPYTRTLLDAAPIPDPDLQRKRHLVRAERRNGAVPANGCPFAGRCLHVTDRCLTERPVLESVGEGSRVACHRHAELPPWTPVSPDDREERRSPVSAVDGTRSAGNQAFELDGDRDAPGTN